MEVVKIKVPQAAWVVCGMQDHNFGAKIFCLKRYQKRNGNVVYISNPSEKKCSQQRIYYLHTTFLPHFSCEMKMEVC